MEAGGAAASPPSCGGEGRGWGWAGRGGGGALSPLRRSLGGTGGRCRPPIPPPGPCMHRRTAHPAAGDGVGQGGGRRGERRNRDAEAAATGARARRRGTAPKRRGPHLEVPVVRADVVGVPAKLQGDDFLHGGVVADAGAAPGRRIVAAKFISRRGGTRAAEHAVAFFVSKKLPRGRRQTSRRVHHSPHHHHPPPHRATMAT
jgi:hypothetical protein